MDLLLNWRSNYTTLYVNGKFSTSADFYHGKDRFHISKGRLPDHSGANALSLYTLSTKTTSTFKGLKVCTTRCQGGENFVFVSTNDHYTEDPNTLLRRRRLEQNNASILKYKYISIIASSLMLFSFI